MAREIKEQVESSDSVWSLADDYEGSCPCAYFELEDAEGKVFARSRCWRVSDNAQDLYVWGDHPDIKSVARLLKQKLDNTKWYSPYTVIFDKFDLLNNKGDKE